MVNQAKAQKQDSTSPWQLLPLALTNTLKQGKLIALLIGLNLVLSVFYNIATSPLSPVSPKALASSGELTGGLVGLVFGLLAFVFSLGFMLFQGGVISRVNVTTFINQLSNQELWQDGAMPLLKRMLAKPLKKAPDGIDAISRRLCFVQQEDTSSFPAFLQDMEQKTGNFNDVLRYGLFFTTKQALPTLGFYFGLYLLIFLGLLGFCLFAALVYFILASLGLSTDFTTLQTYPQKQAALTMISEPALWIVALTFMGGAWLLSLGFQYWYTFLSVWRLGPWQSLWESFRLWRFDFKGCFLNHVILFTVSSVAMVGYFMAAFSLGVAEGFTGMPSFLTEGALVAVAVPFTVFLLSYNNLFVMSRTGCPETAYWLLPESTT